MKSAIKKMGFSLIELLVALGIIAALIGLAIPAINAMQKSFDSTGAESMLSAALATARTLAISNHKYAGIRFQKAGDPNNVLKANQYMIFIIYEEPRMMNNITDAFRAIKGYKPMKLPENMGIMDRQGINLDTDIDDNPKLSDATTFSIIFSPAGKLVIHDVRARHNITDDDDVINTLAKVNSGIAIFVEDSGHEQSRNKCIIYDCDKFSKLDKDNRYNGYLKDLKFIYINPYTGGIIK